MSDIVIKAENIGKLYKLGEIGTGTLSHDLNRWWASLRGKEDPFAKIGQANDRTRKGDSDYVWALRDINFEVRQGEVLGIIGRNGAGKSTLLKILSKVTNPTTGQIKVKGRIASLLEVGTGFHPELTGRENIFLNGAILGMKRSEIQNKFDEIVDFAGVERYIDTPVKRYSSGMYVRLAFAVAAFLEPEILIVDEVLAVGDAEFQKKCLGRMRDVSSSDGRTVLFVSHNVAAISTLCDSSLLLANGQLIDHGPTKKIVDQYIIAKKQGEGEVARNDIVISKKCPYADFMAVRLRSSVNGITSIFAISEDIFVEVDFEILVENSNVHVSVHLLDSTGNCIFASFPGPSGTIGLDNYFGEKLRKGIYRSICKIPANTLNDKVYRISAFLVPKTAAEVGIAEDVILFSVEETGEMRKEYTGEWIGVIRPKMEWQTQIIEKNS
jgi:lipopolysaccharide transport system ATP-binding protein